MPYHDEIKYFSILQKTEKYLDILVGINLLPT